MGVQSASTVVSALVQGVRWGSICEHGRQRSKCKECRAVKAKAELLGDVDAAEQGVKRKRASPTKGPCEHGVKYRSQCKVCRKCEHGRKRYECKECIASRRGQRTADVSRGAPSQDTEKHARQDTDVDEPSEASENEEPDDPSEVDAAEAAHATTRLVNPAYRVWRDTKTRFHPSSSETDAP